MSEPMTSVPVPAAMPSEEEIARAICLADGGYPDFMALPIFPEQGREPEPVWRSYIPHVRAILDLFAPVLAEKERCISGLLSDLEGERSLTAASQDMYKRAKARALAAEAALAGERELRPMSDAPTDGTEIMVWGRANQVPAERERWLVVRYSRGWWTTSSPSMTVKAFAWLQLPPDAAAAIRAQGE